jgi:hypothetical protein
MDCVVFYEKSGNKIILNLDHVSSIKLTTDYERPEVVDYNAHITYHINDKVNSRVAKETFESEEKALQRMDQIIYKTGDDSQCEM